LQYSQHRSTPELTSVVGQWVEEGWFDKSVKISSSLLRTVEGAAAAERRRYTSERRLRLAVLAPRRHTITSSLRVKLEGGKKNPFIQ